MDRIDVWQTYFNSDSALRNRRSSAMHRGIHVQRAGLYDETVAKGPYDREHWYIEYFDAGASSSLEGSDRLLCDRRSLRASPGTWLRTPRSSGT